jgi:hypothetical protein
LYSVDAIGQLHFFSCSSGSPRSHFYFSRH